MGAAAAGGNDLDLGLLIAARRPIIAHQLLLRSNATSRHPIAAVFGSNSTSSGREWGCCFDAGGPRSAMALLRLAPYGFPRTQRQRRTVARRLRRYRREPAAHQPAADMGTT